MEQRYGCCIIILILLIIDRIQYEMPVIEVSCCYLREIQVDQDAQDMMASQDALLVQDLKYLNVNNVTINS